MTILLPLTEMLIDECPDINFSRLTKKFLMLGLMLCDGNNDKPVSNQVFSANASAKKQGTKNEYCLKISRAINIKSRALSTHSLSKNIS